MAISATSGVVSNIDYQSLVTQLVGLKRQPINKMEANKGSLEKTRSVYSSLSSRVGELKTAADALRKADNFKVFTTSVTDSALLGATAGTTASPGNYQVKVNTLAKAHKIAADGLASTTSTIAAGAGFFKFTVGGGATQSIAIDGTTTLTGLKDSINGLNAGVTATLVNDGNAATPYRLILTSNSTGTSNAVSITQNDSSLVFGTTLQAAQNASVTVDGLTYSRSSNTVTDIITGVTLDLKGEDATKTMTLSVNRDTAEVEKKVKAVVDKYNAIVLHIKSNNRYDSKAKVAGPLFGDPVARSIWDDLKRTMTSTVSGLPDTMNRLIHAGVKSDNEGILSLDSATLKNALSSSFGDVVKLFEDGTTTKGFAGLVYDLASKIDDSVDGRIKLRQDGITKNIKNIEDGITRRESEAQRYEDQLRAQFTGLEVMLAKLKHQGSYISNI